MIEAPTPSTTEPVTITQGGIAVTGQHTTDPAPKLEEFQRQDIANESGSDPNVIKLPGSARPVPHAAAPGNTQEAIDAMGLTWREYSEWRRTKCPPPEFRGAVWLDEFDQAIHELIGEIGELSHVVMGNGPFLLAADPETAKIRRAVEDEIGDVAFTASWLFDLIDPSFFGTRGRVLDGFLPAEARGALHQTFEEVNRLKLSPGILNQFHKAPDEVQAVVQFWIGQVESTLFTMFNNAAPISNRFRKVRWHRVKGQGNPFYEQAENVFNVCAGIDAVCTLVGVQLLHAVRRNMAKLDHRFPDGWKPGGGNR